MTTLEQVEKLRSMADISYDEAKRALEEANDDLLQAVINLEKQGKINTPPGGGYYSSERTYESNPGQSYQANQSGSYRQNNAYQKSNCCKENAHSFFRRFGNCCANLLRKSINNTFEVLKNGENKASMPVIVLVLLLIFAFWVTLPLLVIGLFFGFRYRFTGPDFCCDAVETVNNVMNCAADAAENLKKSAESQNN